jgi:hypothetical protein
MVQPPTSGRPPRLAETTNSKFIVINVLNAPW